MSTAVSGAAGSERRHVASGAYVGRGVQQLPTVPAFGLSWGDGHWRGSSHVEEEFQDFIFFEILN